MLLVILIIDATYHPFRQERQQLQFPGIVWYSHRAIHPMSMGQIAGVAGPISMTRGSVERPQTDSIAKYGC